MAAEIEGRADWVTSFEMHEKKVAFIETTATLLGCNESILGRLPDGSKPDVLRVRRPQGLLFIGDAKQTETPGTASTRERLLGYLRWASVHVVSGRRACIFSLCVDVQSRPHRWLRLLQGLGEAAGLPTGSTGIQVFCHDLVVVWSLYPPHWNQCLSGCGCESGAQDPDLC